MRHWTRDSRSARLICNKAQLVRPSVSTVMPILDDVNKTFQPRGSMQQFWLFKAMDFNCSRRNHSKKAKLVNTIDEIWSRSLCNGCYGSMLASDTAEVLWDKFSMQETMGRWACFCRQPYFRTVWLFPSETNYHWTCHSISTSTAASSPITDWIVTNNLTPLFWASKIRLPRFPFGTGTSFSSSLARQRVQPSVDIFLIVSVTRPYE